MRISGARGVVLAVVAGLVLAGCSGDGGDEVDATGAPTSTAASTAAPSHEAQEPDAGESSTDADAGDDGDSGTDGGSGAAAGDFCAQYNEVRDFGMSADSMDTSDIDGALASLDEARATLTGLDVDGEVADARDTVVASLDSVAGAMEDLQEAIPEGVDITDPDYTDLTEEQIEALANFDFTGYMEAITQATGEDFVAAAGVLEQYASEECA